MRCTGRKLSLFSDSKSKFSHNEVIFTSLFRFIVLVLDKRVFLLLWERTVPLHFSKQLSEEVHVFVSKLTLKAAK